ncbi:hypothetical protein AIOL_000453 [Candidatus Rhodobacter oscarellae]|uniref:Uncharacterized protein n=1 Tax=Candidatus Rhodobacter oscarellae TaxID=1675527 RepID=A0A0J9EBZ4_9RHOB|nr:hypothetical protein [Candidatus Rhodobacter lobularis]KMW60300.1 hypothetical protein AIOL_000453 [Candidatus Rhodobacter lobularis]
MNVEKNKPDMLSIQLSQAPGDAGFIVDSVDIAQPNFRHRLSFSNQNGVDAILSPKLAKYVQKLLGSINKDAMVFSEPDTVVELPGLVLGRLRMLVHTGANLARQVIIRFAYFIGGVQAAFGIETHFSLPSVNHREALAVAALHDICIPVFDVVSNVLGGLFGDDTAQRSAQERLSRFTELESELLFYLELLKRYIKSAGEFAELQPPPNVFALASAGGRAHMQTPFANQERAD